VRRSRSRQTSSSSGAARRRRGLPEAQLIAVAGEALTVSKTHARLERHDDVWTITDLASTNGVLVRTFMGEEVEVEPGSKIDAGSGSSSATRSSTSRASNAEASAAGAGRDSPGAFARVRHTA
jgi:hypothetical protein